MTRRVSSWLSNALSCSILICSSEAMVLAQANVQGQWTTLSNTMPINPVHVALLNDGNLLVVAGSGNCPPSQTGCPSGPPYGPSNRSGALLLNPETGQTLSQFSVSWDVFCTDMVILEDGRVLLAGGTIQYDPFYGQPQATIFDPQTNMFSNVQNMGHGRWYPTLLTLGDGRDMVFSGLNETGGTNTTVEFYTANSGWSPQYSAPWTPDLYPRLHLLPNGKVFYSGSQTTSKLFDPSTNTWNTNVATTNYSGMRTYGTSVLLPLTPANNYDPKVIIMGGGNPATNTTEIIDMGSSTPAWQYGPNMSQGRIEMNAVLLPNGKILAVGGSVNDEDVNSAGLAADLYDPVSNTFSSAGSNAYPRLYHSVALLLPDATVFLAGGNPSRGTFEPHIEIYKPAYLFNSDGTLAARPSITAAPGTINYGQAFTVTTPSASSISSVVLVRNGSPTHAYDKDQREVALSFTAGSGTLTVTGPPNSNIAPPGNYMLFILNQTGVPSVASFVQVTAAASSGDFSLAASPSSQIVYQGNSSNYTVSVTSSNGFNGNVSFSLTGLPSGATANFSPSSVSGSGSSTLTISTTASTPTGNYPLSITATSGSLSHSTQVTLAVATPGSSGINPNSRYRIINQASGGCIDDSGNLSNGSPLNQWHCWPGNTNQEWWFWQPSNSAYYSIGDTNTGNLVWSVTSGATSTNSPVQQATYSGAKYQQWAPVLLSSGYYEFVDFNSGLCLTVPGGATTNGLQLQISACSGAPSQSFVLGSLSTSIASAAWYEAINATSGMCVTDPGSSTKNGTALTQATCGTLLNQEWQLQPTSNGYDAVASGSATRLVWDDTNGSTANGNGMQLWSWSNNSNQDWTPHLQSNGLWTFTVLKSGDCLDNAGSTSSGTRMIQWPCGSGNPNQQFELVRVR